MKVKRSELESFYKDFMRTSINGDVFALMPISAINGIYSAGFRAGVTTGLGHAYLNLDDGIVLSKELNEWLESGKYLEVIE